MTESRGRRSPRPPSRSVRLIARIGVPIGVVFGLLAVLGAVSFAVNLVQGNGLYSLVMSLGAFGAFAALAYGVGIELRRNIAAWDRALDDRRRLTGEDF